MINYNINEKVWLNNNEDICIVLCTTPNEITAKNIATNLIIKKIAACVTILPKAISFYCWQNKLEIQSEIQMLIKTHITLQNNVYSYIKNNHPYQVPELLTIAVTNSDINYLSWFKKTMN